MEKADRILELANQLDMNGIQSNDWPVIETIVAALRDYHHLLVQYDAFVNQQERRSREFTSALAAITRERLDRTNSLT